MTTLQVSIPKPCHEDWNAMSQREQGRFCDKCCKTVVDFSTKSPEEVQELLKKSLSEKMCGRFKNEQLSPPVKLKLSFTSVHHHMSALQVFFISLLLAFGTTLFSCTTHRGQTIGKMELIRPVAAETDTESVVADDKPIPADASVHGSPMVSRHEIHCTINFEPMNISDTVITFPQVEVSADSYPPIYKTTGLIAVRSGMIQTEMTDSANAPGEVKSGMEISQNDFGEVTVFPNPARENSTLRLILKRNESVKADLLDGEGRIIQPVIPFDKLEEGVHEINIVTSSLPSATYYIVVKIGEGIETKRLVVIK